MKEQQCYTYNDSMTSPWQQAIIYSSILFFFFFPRNLPFLVEFGPRSSFNAPLIVCKQNSRVSANGEMRVPLIKK